jgi:hypothetical protein
VNARTKLERFNGSAGLALALTVPALADAPPSPWTSEDMGNPAQPGSTQVDASGVWTLSGSGSNSPASGGIHITYQRLQGDASLTAHFRSSGPSDQAYGGLAVREDNTLGSPAVNYGVLRCGTFAGAIFQRGRKPANFMDSGPYNTSRPVLLRLQRVGNAISGFYSTDGTLWSPDFDPASLPTLANDALFGLLVNNVSGANQNQLYTARFDQVQVQSGAVLVTSMPGPTSS